MPRALPMLAAVLVRDPRSRPGMMLLSCMLWLECPGTIGSQCHLWLLTADDTA